jgi:hypothetical protein
MFMLCVYTCWTHMVLDIRFFQFFPSIWRHYSSPMSVFNILITLFSEPFRVFEIWPEKEMLQTRKLWKSFQNISKNNGNFVHKKHVSSNRESLSICCICAILKGWFYCTFVHFKCTFLLYTLARLDLDESQLVPDRHYKIQCLFSLPKSMRKHDTVCHKKHFVKLEVGSHKLGYNLT